MAQVALYLKQLTVNEKTQLARRIVADMTNNASFAKPEPTLAVVSKAVDEVEAAQIAADNGGKEQTFILQAKVKTLETLLTQLGNYVEFITGGDETKIMSAGMTVKAKAAPIGAMPKLTDFKVMNTENSGEFICGVQSVKGAGSYIFQISTNPDDAGKWMIGAVSTKSKAVISGLTSGTKYFVRSAAVGAAGQGPWSDIIQRYAQ